MIYIRLRESYHLAIFYVIYIHLRNLITYALSMIYIRLRESYHLAIFYVIHIHLRNFITWGFFGVLGSHTIHWNIG